MTSSTNTPDLTKTLDDGERDTRQAMWRGIKKKCPQCGQGHLFKGYTSVNDTCSSCGLDFSGHRADDAPPYFTMLIAGHIVIPLALEVKRHFHPPLGLQFLVWGILLGVMAWKLLPITKGAMIALQWAKKMHGFSGNTDKTPGLDVSGS